MDEDKTITTNDSINHADLEKEINIPISEPKQDESKLLDNKKTDDEIERTSKLLKGGDDYFLKVPNKIVEEKQLKEDDYVVVELRKTKSFIIETDKTTMEEVEKLKKLPQYKNKDSGEIVKELMFKFNKKEDVEKIPSKEIKLVEKGSLE